MLAVTVRKCVIQRCITPVQRSALCCTPGVWRVFLTVFSHHFTMRFLRGINRLRFLRGINRFCCLLHPVEEAPSRPLTVIVCVSHGNLNLNVALVARPLVAFSTRARVIYIRNKVLHSLCDMLNVANCRRNFIGLCLCDALVQLQRVR